MLAGLAQAKLPKEPDPTEPGPMSYEEAIRFEKVAMPYGAFEDSEVGNVPRSYLARVLDPSTFNRQLRRYVASRRFQEREE